MTKRPRNVNQTDSKQTKTLEKSHNSKYNSFSIPYSLFIFFSLINRKKEKEAEKRFALNNSLFSYVYFTRREFELQHQPPDGSRFATYDEKQDALEKLHHNIPPSPLSLHSSPSPIPWFIEDKEVILSMLNDLPLMVDTFRLQQRKEFLVQKLNDIEQSIVLYSQPKVCIPV